MRKPDESETHPTLLTYYFRSKKPTRLSLKDLSMWKQLYFRSIFFSDSHGNLKILFFTLSFIVMMAWIKVFKAGIDCRKSALAYNLKFYIDTNCTLLCTFKSETEECYFTFDFFLLGTYVFGIPVCMYQLVQVYIKDMTRQYDGKLRKPRGKQSKKSIKTQILVIIIKIIIMVMVITILTITIISYNL